MTREEAISFGNMWLELNEDAKDSETYQFVKKAISVLSADGEYIKKEDTIGYLNDLFGEMSHVSFGNVLQSLDSLQTYSFPDSADDNTMEWIFDENETCSRCGYVVEGDHDTEFNFCPNCGRKEVSK